MRTLLSFLVAIASLTTFSAAHGSHADAEGDDTSDWATRHMRGNENKCKLYPLVRC